MNQMRLTRQPEESAGQFSSRVQRVAERLRFQEKEDNPGHPVTVTAHFALDGLSATVVARVTPNGEVRSISKNNIIYGSELDDE